MSDHLYLTSEACVAMRGKQLRWVGHTNCEMTCFFSNTKLKMGQHLLRKFYYFFFFKKRILQRWWGPCMPVSVHMCVWLCASESRRDYSAICDFADWSEQPVAPCPDEEMDRWMSACASWAFYDLPCLSVIEKVAWLCCLGIFPPSIMQLQNRKTNSGNRPPNVINFVGVGGEGGWRGTIIAGGRILISCRFLPVWLAWPWPITSELCVTVSLPVLPKEWTEAGTAEHWQDGERRWRTEERERRDRERKTERDTWRWDCRAEEGEEKEGGKKGEGEIAGQI